MTLDELKERHAELEKLASSMGEESAEWLGFNIFVPCKSWRHPEHKRTPFGMARVTSCCGEKGDMVAITLPMIRAFLARVEAEGIAV